MECYVISHIGNKSTVVPNIGKVR